MRIILVNKLVLRFDFHCRFKKSGVQLPQPQLQQQPRHGEVPPRTGALRKSWIYSNKYIKS